jgi:hypothetical protein
LGKNKILLELPRILKLKSDLPNQIGYKSQSIHYPPKVSRSGQYSDVAQILKRQKNRIFGSPAIRESG